MSYDRLLPVHEAANFLNISKPTLYRWVKARRIPCIKNGSYLRFSQDALTQWLQDNMQEPLK